MRTRGEVGFAGGDGPLVPRADVEAVIAAEDAVAEGFAILDRDGALVLDGQVGEALARIHLVRRDDRGGRARVDATGAGAAAIRLLGGGGFQFEGRQDDAEEEPGTRAAVDEDRALALPAEAGGGRDGFFEHRAGVDVGLLFAPEGFHHDAQLLQAFEDHVVVIPAQRVFRDAVARGRMRLVIVQAHHDQAAGFGQHFTGVGTAVRVTGQPGHVAVHPVGDPLLEVVRAYVDLDRRDPEGVEAQLLRRSRETLAEGAGIHRLSPGSKARGSRSLRPAPACRRLHSRRPACLRPARRPHDRGSGGSSGWPA